MLFIIILICAIVVFTLYFSKIIHNHLFSPISIMAVMWLIPALSTYYLSIFVNEKWTIEYSTWVFVIIGSFLAFFCGYLVHFFVWRKKTNLLRFEFDKEPNGWDKRALKNIIIILFIIGMIGFAINLSHVIRYGGLSVYTNSGFRQAELIFGSSTLINYLYFLNGFNFILTVFYTLKYGKNPFILACLVLSFATLFFHGIRSTIIFPIAITGWIVILSNRKFRFRYIILPAIIGFLIFQTVSIGRDYPVYSALGLGIGEMFMAGLQKPIYYVAPNYANIQKEIENRKDFSWGGNTIGPFVDLLKFFISPDPKRNSPMTVAEMESMMGDGQDYLVETGYNVGTYLRNFYQDFGFEGIYIFPFLLGIITTLFYINFIRWPSVKNLLIYSIIATMMTFSFWYNEFLRIQFWYWIGVIFLIDIIIRIRPKKYLSFIKKSYEKD